MQKVILDTNVVVSSLIQKGFSYYILHDLYLEGKFELCVSQELLNEYYEVLMRPKFIKFPNFFSKAETFLADISSKASLFKPTITLDLILDDDDNMMIELADECHADFIITGNTNDFTFPIYKTTKIVTPKNYWENYKPV